MSAKKLLLVLLLIVGVGALMVSSTGQTEAADHHALLNHPPECYPILFFDEGYWGVSCIDDDNNITSVTLKTNSDYSVDWDNSHAQMIVEMEPNTHIFWEVCDANHACVSNVVR